MTADVLVNTNFGTLYLIHKFITFFVPAKRYRRIHIIYVIHTDVDCAVLWIGEWEWQAIREQCVSDADLHANGPRWIVY